MSFQFVILGCAAALAAVSAISEDAAVAAERRRHWAEVLERQEKIFYETGLAQLSPIQARYAQFLSVRRFYRMFINYCVFSLKCCDFSELCQFCCSASVLPLGV